MTAIQPRKARQVLPTRKAWRWPRAIPWVLGGLGTLSLAAGLSLWVGVHSSVDWPVTLEAISHVAQAVALVAGGVWTYRLFVQQRLGRPRANLGLRIDYVATDTEHRFVRVTTLVRNVGTVSIQPPEANATVSQILPLAPDRTARLREGAEAGDDAERVEDAGYHSVGQRTVDLAESKMVLDPGESDDFSVEFIIPPEVAAILVETEVDCGSDKEGISWRTSALLRVDSESGTFTSLPAA